MLSGGMAQQQLPNPAMSWLSDRAWQDILGLSALPNFSSMADSFSDHMLGFKKIFDSNQPHRLPGKTHQPHVKQANKLVYCVFKSHFLKSICAWVFVWL